LAVISQPGGEHAQHALCVEPVRLSPASAAVHQDAGRLEHIGGDAVSRQQAVQPEAIATGLKAASYVDGAAEIGRSLRPQIGDRLE
jgi:hypothetical protein